MLTKYLSCKEKMRLSYMEGLEPTKRSTEAMDFGTYIHECLDLIYTKLRDSDPQDFLANIKTHVSDACGTYYDVKREFMETEGYDLVTLDEHAGIAEALLPEYFEFWREDFFTIKWRFLEEEFCVYVEFKLNGVRYRIPVRGKIDGGFDTPKEFWMFETKTKGRINEDQIMSQLPIDLQVNLYFLAIFLKFGEWPNGVVYNLIRKPQLRQGKNETLVEYCKRCRADIFDRPEFYFSRIHVSVTKEEIIQWRDEQLIPMLQDLVLWYEDITPHYRNVKSCTSGFYPCEFLPICGQGNRANFKLRETLFSELKVV